MIRAEKVPYFVSFLRSQHCKGKVETPAVGRGSDGWIPTCSRERPLGALLYAPFTGGKKCYTHLNPGSTTCGLPTKGPVTRRACPGCEHCSLMGLDIDDSTSGSAGEASGHFKECREHSRALLGCFTHSWRDVYFEELKQPCLCCAATKQNRWPVSAPIPPCGWLRVNIFVCT